MPVVVVCWALAMVSGLLWARWLTGTFSLLMAVAFVWLKAGALMHLTGWIELIIFGVTPWLLSAAQTRDQETRSALHAKEAERMTRLSELARALLSLQAATREMEAHLAEIGDVYHVTKETARTLHLEELFAASLDIAPRLLTVRGLRLIDLSQETPQVLRAAQAPDGRMVVSSEGEADISQTHRASAFEQAIIKQLEMRAETAVATAQTLQCALPEGLARVAWAPLWREQKLVGVLVADDLPEPQLKTLSIVANQLSLQLSRIRLYQQVEALAVTDALTGLSVRRYFVEQAREELVRSKRHGMPCTLLMVDLDLFKKKNDTYGHLVGDVVLKDVANLLQRNLREVDLIARFGGEEFILLLIETNMEQALTIAQRLKQLVELHPIRAYDELLTQTISIGVAGFPQHAQTLEALIERADQALYAAKHAGRNQVVCWSESPKP